MHAICGGKNEKFGELKDNLSKIYLLGYDQYPKKREGLVNLLNNWKGYKKQQQKKTRTTTVQYEVAFLQEGAYSGNKNGKRVNAAG